MDGLQQALLRLVMAQRLGEGGTRSYTSIRSQTELSLLARYEGLSWRDEQHKGSVVHWICEANNLELLKEVFSKYDAQDCLQIRDKNGWSPLYIAIRSGHDEVFKYLVDNHTEAVRSILLQQNRDCWTHLHCVVVNNRQQMFDKIMTTFPNEMHQLVNVCTNKKETPVFLAVRENEEDMLRQLLETENGRKALVVPTKKGVYPMHFAVAKNRRPLVELMLKYDEGKRSLFFTDKDNDSMMHMCAYSDEDPGMMINILENHQEVVASGRQWNIKGFSAVQLASRKNSSMLLREMLKVDELRKDLLSVDSQGRTPFFIACRHNCTDALKEILRHQEGMDSVNVEDLKGRLATQLKQLNSESKMILEKHQLVAAEGSA
eukprot:CAMPEP_0117437764 /NCGR_PEP_ID=MMETSP0759-20121206/1700_1 /TAXON_ID=63605 /ORGANISM="Percolomonas cosmopolitus, Strain WS" /LENGTH=374 /DNA_ID=CAMNT_0005229423 /DNA_START=685 /DNA_END=1809 /DNA_ORIENTATION=-